MTEKAKNMGGRPRHEPTEEQRYSVELMAAIGVPQDQISAALGIAEKTLRRHFRDELDNGKIKVGSRVADSIVRQALAGNMTAAIFYAKTQMGWKETVHVDNTSSDGSMSPKGSDADALDAINRRLDSIATAGKAKGGSCGD